MTKYVFFKAEEVNKLSDLISEMDNGQVITQMNRIREGNSSQIKLAVTNRVADERVVDTFIEELDLKMSR